MDNNKKNFFRGAVFGLLVPFLGMFVGMQISPSIGSILMFPFIIISKIIGQPFGDFSIMMWILSLVVSIVLWGFVFAGVARLISR